MDPNLSASATELATLTRTGRLSSRELVQKHIDRLENVNPAINAVIHRMYERAMVAARLADERTARAKSPDELPPFHGVPCTIKGAFAIEGEPFEVGSWYRRGMRATTTATAVQRYLDAGAIPICISNVPEALTWVETSNRLNGCTKNPHRRGLSPGGSSGGEAAIIAAGAAPFGLGTDFGASIRLPSYFCGIAGHKPTGGIVPGDGQWPLITGAINVITCIGPMARRAEDLYPLLKVLAGPALKGPTPADVGPGRTKIYFHAENGCHRTHPAVQENVRAAAKKLEGLGYTVEEWCPAGLAHSAEIWLAVVAAVEGQPPFTEVLGNGKAIPLLREWLALPFGLSKHTLPTLVLAAMDKLSKLRPGMLADGVRKCRELQLEIETKLGTDGVILGPSYSHPPVRHHMPKVRTFNWTYGGVYNVLEMPSTAVPTGKFASGLPAGVQLTAARGNDGLTIGVGLALEQPVTPVEPG